MNRLHKLDDIQLAERVQRLRHDVEDFQTRARKESAALERAGRSIAGNPLHQRLTSILTFLRDELASAEAEVRRRATAAAVQPRRSLKQAVLDACNALAETLRLEKRFHGDPLRVHVDNRDIQGGVKKWEWIKKGVPIRIEIGPRDIETRKVCLQRRDRPNAEKEFMDKEEFLQLAPDILQQIHDTLLQRATDFRDANIQPCDSIEAFHAHWGQDNPGWLITPWAGTPEQEDELSKQHKITIRCLPLDRQEEPELPCILTGQPVRSRAIWGRSY